MKHATACRQCRTTKRKCTQNPADPQASCLACKSRNLECSKPWNIPRSRHLVQLTVPKTRLVPSTRVVCVDDQNDIHSSTEASEFIRLYLRYIHDRPHSLFHERSLWNSLSNGDLPEGLIAAICALGCRFAAGQVQQDLASAFRERSKSLLAQHLEDISIENIQTCILLANSYAAERNNQLEALYFGTYFVWIGHMTSY